MKLRGRGRTEPAPPSSEPGEAPRQPWRVEGAPAPSGSGPKPARTRTPSWIAILAGALLLNWVLAGLLTSTGRRTTIPYSTFIEQVQAHNVVEVDARGDTVEGVMGSGQVDGRTIGDFRTVRPRFAKDDLLTLLRANGVEPIKARSTVASTPVWAMLLLNFGPTLVLVGLMVAASRSLRGAGGIGGIGRSKAVRADELGPKRVTFDDVAGIDEVEEQLSEIVSMLREPARYQLVGAQLPRGVLLSGPPGTGKTLLARAVAGEAGVPFFSASAAEFIEMIVGVGASRVRDLFDQAKKVAPSMIFIDELDAIGRARGGGASLGGVDEREQTLNQILTEMDGFTRTDGVIVIAATNRPDVLDPALLRPGRFDRRVVVNPPDMTGRAAILAIHTRQVPLEPDVALTHLASITPGMVGADLKNLVNEAALLAAKNGHDRVGTSDFTTSLEKIILGAERHITLSDDDRRRTAYHESGHALLGMLVPGSDPVRKISIIPRGNALGVTFQTPDTDRYGYDATYLRGRIIGGLGGRAAEEIVFGNVTTGAESDLEMITSIARQMVGRWGMSDAIGPVTVLPSADATPWYPGDPRSPSETTRQLVDTEARALIDRCYDEATTRLRSHRAELDRLAEALLRSETLDEAGAHEAAGIPAGIPTP